MWIKNGHKRSEDAYINYYIFMIVLITPLNPKYHGNAVLKQNAVRLNQEVLNSVNQAIKTSLE